MTTVEFLHSKGLKKWNELTVTSSEHNRVIFLRQLLDEWLDLNKQNLGIPAIMQAEGSAVSEGAAVASEGQGEANTCADYCWNAENNQERCDEICTYCSGKARRA